MIRNVEDHNAHAKKYARRRSMPTIKSIENKPLMLASKLKEINNSRRSMMTNSSVDTSNHHLKQNIAKLKKYISDVSESSMSEHVTLKIESDDAQDNRSYKDIKNDLLSLHRRQSLRQTKFVMDQNTHDYVKGNTIEKQNLNLVPYREQKEISKRNLRINMFQSEDGTFKLKGQPRKYAQDYISMANEYKRMESYRCNNTTTFQNACLQCNSMIFKKKPLIRNAEPLDSKTSMRPCALNELSKVFFPCEHLCICNACFNDNGPWHKCPLCNQNIKVVFEHTGRETEDYWKWVNEIKPKLPSNFRKSFPRLSRKAISDAMAKSIEDDSYPNSVDEEAEESYYDENEVGYAVKSKACIIS